MTSRTLDMSRLALPEDGGAAQRTRNRLLQAGIRCFAELGYDAAGTRVIETAAGVNRNLIAHHWGSKEAFWQACVDCLAGAFAHEFARAEAQAVNVGGVERLRFLVRAFVRASARYPEMHRIMLDEGKRADGRLGWIVARHVKGLRDRIADLLAHARAQGAVPPMDAHAFYYAMVGAASMYAMAAECRMLFGIDPTDDDQVARHADAIAHMLIPGPAGARGNAAPAGPFANDAILPPP